MRMIMISVANDLPIFGGRVGGLRPIFWAVDAGLAPVPDDLLLVAGMHAACHCVFGALALFVLFLGS